MEKIYSYSQVEKKYIHSLRNRLKLSEDLIDINNAFQELSTNFVNEVCGEEIAKMDDVSLDSNYEDVVISDHLKQNDQFREIYEHSDLKNILEKFSVEAIHHAEHYKRHDKRVAQNLNNSSKGMW